MTDVVIYRGGDSFGPSVVRIAAGARKPLPPRHDLRNHSPDGFAWGYGGSGPAQLALALLADVMGDEFAQQHYQDFKFERIAMLPQRESWTMTSAEIREWAAAQAKPA